LKIDKFEVLAPGNRFLDPELVENAYQLEWMVFVTVLTYVTADKCQPNDRTITYVRTVKKSSKTSLVSVRNHYNFVSN